MTAVPPYGPAPVTFDDRARWGLLPSIEATVSIPMTSRYPGIVRRSGSAWAFICNRPGCPWWGIFPFELVRFLIAGVALQTLIEAKGRSPKVAKFYLGALESVSVAGNSSARPTTAAISSPA